MQEAGVQFNARCARAQHVQRATTLLIVFLSVCPLGFMRKTLRCLLGYTLSVVDTSIIFLFQQTNNHARVLPII